MDPWPYGYIATKCLNYFTISYFIYMLLLPGPVPVNQKLDNALFSLVGLWQVKLYWIPLISKIPFVIKRQWPLEMYTKLVVFKRCGKFGIGEWIFLWMWCPMCYTCHTSNHHKSPGSSDRWQHRVTLNVCNQLESNHDSHLSSNIWNTGRTKGSEVLVKEAQNIHMQHRQWLED